MIEVSSADFYRLHSGLVRVLKALDEAGPQGLPTRSVGEKIFNSRTHGWRMVVQAEKLGYVVRERVPKPKTVGGYPYTMNRITPKGRKLLKELG